MRIADQLFWIQRALRAGRLRTVLTAVGIAIGIVEKIATIAVNDEH